MYKPCADCPFFHEHQFHLNEARKEEIVDSIRSDKSFHCHKTVKYLDDDAYGLDNAEECVGSIILQEKEGRINQMLRIYERIGMYDRSKLDMDAMPYESFDAWIDGDYRGR